MAARRRSAWWSPTRPSPTWSGSRCSNATASWAWRRPNLRQGVASLLSRDRIRQGIKVQQDGDELHIKLYIIIEYGLNVAEVAGNVRSQVAYNVQKMLGRPATTLRIYVQGVRVGER